MTLHAHCVVRRPTHTTTVGIDGEPGEVVALIGPNGAGKTTALRAIAGLVPLTSGVITVDDVVLADDHTHVPTHRRNVGYVFQDHLLFPHLTAVDNVAFGLRSRGVARGIARQTAKDWLGRLAIAEVAGQRPGQLSGGQAQRVAIARALAGNPSLLLLDEPTASLDVAAAMRLRTSLRQHLRDFAGVSVLVTHTALDTMVLADRVLVMQEGRIVQQGTPTDVAAYPKTQHVAALVGLNLIRGDARNGVLSLPGGEHLVTAEQISGSCCAAFPPSAVSLFTTTPSGSPRNVWRSTVTSLTPHGDAVRVHLDAPTPLLADVTPAALASLDLQVGSIVWAAVKATEVAVYPA